MVTQLNGSPRPRTVVNGDTSRLRGNTVGSKTFGIVAELPFLEQSEPVQVSTQQALKQLMSSDYTLQFLAHLIYNASADPNVASTPNSIVVVNAKPTAQAQVTIDDHDDTDSLTIKSNKWGGDGNKATYKIESGTNNGIKVSLTAPWAVAESQDDVGGEDVVSFSYTGSDANTMVVTFDTTNGLRITYTDSGIALGAFSTPDYPIDGTISITPSTGASGGEEFEAVITGTVGGVAATETLTWDNADGTTQKTTSASFEAIDSIVFSETGSDTPTFTITGYAFDLDPGTYTKTSQLVDAVNAAANFTATNEEPRASSRDTTKADQLIGRWLGYDGGTADFTVGAVVTGGTSGARGTIASIQGATAQGALQLVNVVGEFSDNEALTDDNSTPGAATCNGTLGDWYTDYDNGTDSALPTVGETVSNGSGDSGVLVGLYNDGVSGAGNSAGYIVVDSSAGAGFSDNDTVTGATSSNTVDADGDTVLASSISIKAVTIALQDTLHAAIDAFSGSAIATLSAASGAVAPPQFVTTATNLTGGSSSTTTASDWTAALEAVRTYDVDTFWIDSDSATQHAALRAHCNYMAGDGGYACDGVVGAAASETEAQLHTRTKSLNNRNIALVFQGGTKADQTGATVTLTPKHVALMEAAMKCSVRYGVPMTRKRPDLLTVTQNSNIDPDSNAATLLKKGLLFITSDSLGFRWERSITTYQTDSNRVYTEQSTNESYNLSNNDVRAAVDSTIGAPGVATLDGRIKSIVYNRLRIQVRDQAISAFTASSIVVENLGDYRRVSYTISLIEPNNFVELIPAVVTLEA